MRNPNNAVAALLDELRVKGICNNEVLAAIAATPRHLFVDPTLTASAYEDHALPIACGQTISQPYIVAHMTEVLLAGGPLSKVLEIGTGSGYQAAILARLVPEVYTIERIHVLYEQACARFKTMGLTNIQARFSDGYAGWPEVAPFAGIIATAAAPEVPPALLAQLAIGGRLIIPVGDQGVQQLKLIIRINENEYKTEIIEAVVFVPLLKGTDE